MTRKYSVIVGLGLLALLVLLLSPCFGMVWIDPLTVFTHPTLDSGIFWSLRVPRVLAAFVCGSALAVAGMAFQALFQSPLATPYTLGVASGASLGSVLAVVLQGWLWLPPGASPECFALAGACLTALLIFSISHIRRAHALSTLLLAGVALNYFFGSAVALIQYLSDYTNVFRILHTLLGGLDGIGLPELLRLLWLLVPGTVLILALSRELDLLGLGEDLAVSRGLNLRRVHQLLLVATSLIVGGIVAICGPIGFVGMMAPHIGRLLVGGQHQRLGVVSLLLGGILLTVCDTIARTLIAPAEIPVGVITALLGCPFFLWLLLRRKSAST